MSYRRLIAFVCSGLAASCTGQPSAPPSAPPRSLILQDAPSEAQNGEPGWLLSGGGRDVYAVHRDTADGRPALLLEPIADTFGHYGTWMRHIDAANYRDKRVRITAMIKTQGATQRADFWARAQAKDSPADGSGLGGDARQLPPESTWTEEALVMDVPTDTAWLEYGIGV